MADLTIATVNVNGLRAAVFGRKNGSSMVKWFKLQKLDILCLQETRISKEKNKKELARICTMLGIVAEDFYLQEDENDPSRHGGVAVWVNPKTCSVMPHETKDLGFSGRWQEILVKFNNIEIMIANSYYHSAKSPFYKGINPVDSTISMNAKHCFFDKTTQRMRELIKIKKYDNFILVGDINTAHHNIDICNVKGNEKMAGFLPEERAWLDLWFAEKDKPVRDVYKENPKINYTPPPTNEFEYGGLGLHDVIRDKYGNGKDGIIYSMWSWRGSQFDDNAGRRIDYQIASESMAKSVVKAKAKIQKQASDEQRWSDHAPVVVTYSV